MELFASLGTSRVIAARLTINAWGAPVADVQLAEDDVLPLVTGGAVLTLGSLSQVMTVVRTAPWTGSRAVRLVGGFGGWGSTVDARFYADPKGVRLSTVLGDLARACGEELFPGAPTTSLGQQWARARGAASSVLAVLVGRGWWVNSLGLTVIGERPSAAVAGDFVIESYQADRGRFTIATEAPEEWVPGAVFSRSPILAAQVVRSVTVNLDSKGRMRLEVMVP